MTELKAGFILLIVSLLVACSETPSGRPQLALIPEEMLSDMGQQAFAEMKQTQPVESDSETNEIVACIADRIITASTTLYPNFNLPPKWEVIVFRNDTPNAFAMPGGRIGVHTGLIKIAETEAQLAAVIGHEVGHLMAKHGNERMTQQLGINVVLLLVGLFSDGDSRLLLGALGIGAQLGVTLPFSRAHEEEADILGLNLMAAAGYDPTDSTALWRNMAEQSQNQSMEFLSTHPGHETRINNLQASMETALALYVPAPECDA